jgi:nucleoside-diphosphate-sugar epimerase
MAPGTRFVSLRAPARTLQVVAYSFPARDITAVTQRIGVIRGSGFIGTWLVEALLIRDHAVRIIDVNPSQKHLDLWVAADVRDRESLSAACSGCEVLFNLAAKHRDEVRPTELCRQVNVVGAHTTCEIAERLQIDRLIFTSTMAVYGLLEGVADETTTTRPLASMAGPSSRPSRCSGPGPGARRSAL